MFLGVEWRVDLLDVHGFCILLVMMTTAILFVSCGGTTGAKNARVVKPAPLYKPYTLLLAAPTRRPNTFKIFHSTVGSAWLP